MEGSCASHASSPGAALMLLLGLASLSAGALAVGEKEYVLRRYLVP